MDTLSAGTTDASRRKPEAFSSLWNMLKVDKKVFLSEEICSFSRVKMPLQSAPAAAGLGCLYYSNSKLMVLSGGCFHSQPLAV